MADQENTTITQLRRSPRKTRRPNYTDPGSTRPVSGFGQKRSPKRKLQTTPPPAKRQCLRSNTNVSNQPSQPTSSEEDEQATCHELKAQICRLQALNKTLQRKVYAMEQELSPQRNSISKRKTSKDGHAHKAKRRNNQAINRRKKQDEETMAMYSDYLSVLNEYMLEELDLSTKDIQCMTVKLFYVLLLNGFIQDKAHAYSIIMMTFDIQSENTIRTYTNQFEDKLHFEDSLHGAHSKIKSCFDFPEIKSDFLKHIQHLSTQKHYWDSIVLAKWVQKQLLPKHRDLLRKNNINNIKERRQQMFVNILQR